jgi:MraZ protein
MPVRGTMWSTFPRSGEQWSTRSSPFGSRAGRRGGRRPAPGAGPRLFTGSFDHSVDDKSRLVLPAPFRPRLAAGAYLGPSTAAWACGPTTRWTRCSPLGRRRRPRPGVRGGGRGVRGRHVPVQPDGQGRIVVHRSLRAFADLTGPVMVVGARRRVGVWSRDRWDRRMGTIPRAPTPRPPGRPGSEAVTVPTTPCRPARPGPAAGASSGPNPLATWRACRGGRR